LSWWLFEYSSLTTAVLNRSVLRTRDSAKGVCHLSGAKSQPPRNLNIIKHHISWHSQPTIASYNDESLSVAFDLMRGGCIACFVHLNSERYVPSYLKSKYLRTTTRPSPSFNGHKVFQSVPQQNNLLQFNGADNASFAIRMVPALNVEYSWYFGPFVLLEIQERQFFMFQFV
jgi:hypothetical protein